MVGGAIQLERTSTMAIVSRRWTAAHSSKAYGEKFMLLYSPVWMAFLAVVVIRKWYEEFRPFDYVLVGLGLSLPCVIAPFLFAGEQEKRTPPLQRYIIKANIFIGIVSYIGNHFNTHYFYNVLGVRYTGPLGPGRGWEINQVPVSMYLMTHVYFMTYHVLITPLLRGVKTSFRTSSPLQYIAVGLFVVVAAFLTAFAETWTISNFPYYTYPDYYQMLTKGSVFYGTFFVVTFPWFARLDENPWKLWSVGKVVREALGAMMTVLLCDDAWRLILEYFDLTRHKRVPYA